MTSDTSAPVGVPWTAPRLIVLLDAANAQAGPQGYFVDSDEEGPVGFYSP